MTEHPKSAVYRHMAQNIENPDATQLVINDVNYEHVHQPIDNKNIFTCIITCTMNKKCYTVTSDSYLTKKDAEKDAFDALYKLIQKKIKTKKSEKDTDSTDSTSEEKKSINKQDSTKSMFKKSADQISNLSKQINSIDISSSSLTESSSTTYPHLTESNLCSKSVSRDDDEISIRKQKNKTEWKEDITGTNLSKTIIVVVDFENICKQSDINKLSTHIKSFMSQQQELIIKVIKIAGFCSSVKNTADIVVRSNRNDAVDHYISYLVGKLESSNFPPKKIYIISRDKFGSCLQDFCNNVEHSSDVSDFISSFN